MVNLNCSKEYTDMLIRSIFIALLLVLFMAQYSKSETKSYPHAKVSFDDFKSLVSAVENHRAIRLVSLDKFLEMSRDPNTIILDTRSDFRFERLHLKGAKHLSFTDFTQDNLAKAIPSLETRILIYCNNNFKGNQIDFASKISLPKKSPIGSQITSQEKPLMMALNIPTYINLYGYGYQNVYELDELVDVNDSRINFEGTIVEK